MMAKIQLFGIQFDNFDFDDLLQFMDTVISERRSTYIVTCNVDHLVKLQKDLHFQEVYAQADVVVADGMPIIWASKILGKRLKQKLSGSDVLHYLGNQFQQKQYRLFFLGAAEGIAELAASNLKKKFPRINVVGCYSPTYGFENNDEENARIVQMMQETKPDIVFVGVGAPKQEKWIYSYYKQYNVPVSIGVGASFDFLSGNIKRAPRIFQRIGLEWFWRLCQEPRRLWRRYLVDDLIYLRLLLRELRATSRADKRNQNLSKGGEME
ncbi:N-acetylglucosaminyldiphosphoundecaprenol N-acetyl-beta-D-mannosaminyltransferase [Paenibacillus sp. V4I9]|nr:N-acetylglucosaminyldiphosphoundecaprenol N-acetyl-beta-D-mannosaminyltransferase [Paenibacillus sp. V4I9]